jgi:hypothetical protein
MDHFSVKLVLFVQIITQVTKQRRLIGRGEKRLDFDPFQWSISFSINLTALILRHNVFLILQGSDPTPVEPIERHYLDPQSQ